MASRSCAVVCGGHLVVVCVVASLPEVCESCILTCHCPAVSARALRRSSCSFSATASPLLLSFCMSRHVTCGRGPRYRSSAAALLALYSLGLPGSRAAQLVACLSSTALFRRWCSLLAAYGSRAAVDLAAAIFAHHGSVLSSGSPSAALRHCSSLRVTLHRRGSRFRRLLPREGGERRDPVRGRRRRWREDARSGRTRRRPDGR